MPYEVKVSGVKLEETFELKDFPSGKIGIVTEDPYGYSSSMIGKPAYTALGPASGSIQFIGEGTYSGKDSKYRLRHLRPGEVITITGK